LGSGPEPGDADRQRSIDPRAARHDRRPARGLHSADQNDRRACHGDVDRTIDRNSDSVTDIGPDGAFDVVANCDIDVCDIERNAQSIDNRFADNVIERNAHHFVKRADIQRDYVRAI
jgi:hypothetical protein